MAIVATVDQASQIVLSVNPNGDPTAAPPLGTFFVPTDGTVTPGAQYGNPSDGVYAPAGSPLISVAAMNLSTLRQNAQTALVNLRTIRDAPQITTANLAAVQQLQTAVQAEARIILGIARLILGLTDGTT